MRLLIVALALLLTTPSASRAQAQAPGKPNLCGELENKVGVLERTARYFVDPGQAQILEGLGIEQPGPAASQAVVEDQRLCAPLMGRVRGQLGSSGVMKNLRPSGFDAAVFRYGPLLAVLVLGRMTEAQFPNTPYGELLIFDEETMTYLGSVIGG